MILSTNSANQIVRELQKLTDQQINLMDEKGIILASTDLKRINNFHEGAYRIITEHLPELYITSQMETPQMRRGINLPIEVTGEIQGVIGITGDYDEVIKLGRIVKKMTEILIQEQLELSAKNRSQMEMNRFLESWILHRSNLQGQALNDVAASLGVDMRRPRRIMVLSLGNPPSAQKKAIGGQLLEQVSGQILAFAEERRGLILRDLDRYILILYRGSDVELSSMANYLVEQIKRQLGVQMCAGIDDDVPDVYLAYRQASRAWMAAWRTGVSVMCYSQLNIDLFLEDISSKRKREYLDKIFKGCTPQETSDWMVLLQCYYRCEGSLSAAAEALFIHKNTLQYRLNRLQEATGLDVRKTSQSPALYMALRFYNDLQLELPSY